MNFRRSDFDVTNRINTTDPVCVKLEVDRIFRSLYARPSAVTLNRAFDDMVRLYRGEFPGYAKCDTGYHDLQHVLEVTLAMTRLLDGYERSRGEGRHIPERLFELGVICALYHDIGYIRRLGDTRHRNGAEYTRTHVSRGARFLEEYLPELGFGAWVPVVTEIIHFTGYEVPFARIEAQVADPRDITVGHLLGTADMIAQIADRCYLEKCRDRLYAEFVLGGVALPLNEGNPQVKYASGLDLLRQTPDFIADVRTKRLEGDFHSAYRYLEILYGGGNPYIEAIERNVEYLRQILRSENWQLLRRRPPIFAATNDPMATMRGLMLGHIKRVWSGI